MINLTGTNFYNELLDLKRKNSNKRKKNLETSAFLFVLSFILSLKFSALICIITVVALFWCNLINYTSMIPNYESFYYLTFLPQLLNHVGIYDLGFVKEQEGYKRIRKSGLDLLTKGNIVQSTCFYKESNEFNYFGYYRKTKKVHQGKESRDVTTFDGYFFMKKIQEESLFDFRIVGFKPQDENILNKKGYSGKAFLNYEEFTLSDRAIDLLTGLQKEFGKIYLCLEDGYLAIQFLSFGTCTSYNLEPCLKKGVDTEDHFKIIELSKMDSKIAPIVNELLEDVSLSVLKK